MYEASFFILLHRSVYTKEEEMYQRPIGKGYEKCRENKSEYSWDEVYEKFCGSVTNELS